MTRTIQQTILGCYRRQRAGDRRRDGIYLMKNPCGIRSVIGFDDNLTMPHDHETVEATARSCTCRREKARCPEINRLRELPRIHTLFFWGRGLPFFRWPDWLCCVLNWTSSIANCG